MKRDRFLKLSVVMDILAFLLTGFGAIFFTIYGLLILMDLHPYAGMAPADRVKCYVFVILSAVLIIVGRYMPAWKKKTGKKAVLSRIGRF